MIENVRDPNQSFEAVYFLSAKPDIVACVLHDFRSGRELYAAANLFFVDAAEDALIEKLAKIGPRIKVLRELYLDFCPRESQIFTTHDNEAPLMLYNPSCGSLVQRLIKEMAMRIVCVCIMLGEYPTIRYSKATEATHAAKSLAAKLANTVQAELDNHARNNESFPPRSDRPRGVLIITDRSLDLNAPLIHEFTYQAMVNDLLPVKDGCSYEFQVESGNGKEKVQQNISEQDTAWLGVRHMHMSLAIDKLVQDFNKFTKDNAAFSDDQNATSLNTIRDMLAGMDSYATGKDKYSLYINMAQECMQKFEKTNLPATAQVEQNCATGVTAVGKTTRDVLEAMIPLLDDEKIPEQDRLRMLMIYVIFKNGIFADDRSKLLRHANISRGLSEALLNLDLLGVPPTKDSRNKRRKEKRQSPVSVDEAFELSRYTPKLMEVLEDHLSGALDPIQYPYTRDVPPDPEIRNTTGAQGSLRTNRPAWAKGRTQVDIQRQRIIVFVAGGATYSEIRSAYSVSETQNRDVILGCSNVVTPNDWLEIMALLRRDREDLRLQADAPQVRIPLLEQPPTPQPQAAAPHQDKKKMRPFSGGSREEVPRQSPEVKQVEAGTEKEKTKKKFGLFGKKK